MRGINHGAGAEVEHGGNCTEGWTRANFEIADSLVSDGLQYNF